MVILVVVLQDHFWFAPIFKPTTTVKPLQFMFCTVFTSLWCYACRARTVQRQFSRFVTLLSQSLFYVPLRVAER